MQQSDSPTDGYTSPQDPPQPVGLLATRLPATRTAYSRNPYW